MIALADCCTVPMRGERPEVMLFTRTFGVVFIKVRNNFREKAHRVTLDYAGFRAEGRSAPR